MEKESFKRLDAVIIELGGIRELKDKIISSYQEIVDAEQDNDCPWMFPSVAQALYEFNVILNAIKE